MSKHLGTRSEFVDKVGKGLKERIDNDKRAEQYKRAAAGDAGATQEAIDQANKEMNDQIDFLRETVNDLWSLNNKRPTKTRVANRLSESPKDPIAYMNASFVLMEEMYDNLLAENPHNNQGEIKARVVHSSVVPANLLGKANGKMSSAVAKLIWKKFRRGEGDICNQQLVEVYADYAPLALAPLPKSSDDGPIDIRSAQNAKRITMLPKFYGLIGVGKQIPKEGDIISGFFESSSPESGVFVKVIEQVDKTSSTSSKSTHEKSKGKTQMKDTQ